MTARSFIIIRSTGRERESPESSEFIEKAKHL